MPYADNNRQRKLRHIGSQLIIVESIKLRSSPAATDNHHTVEQTGIRVYPAQRRNYGHSSSRPLHSGRKKARIEFQSCLIAMQLVHKIAVPGSRTGRNHGYALRHRRHRQFLIKINDSLALQTVDYLHTLPCHIAESVYRIDVGYHKRIAELLMEVRAHLNHHLQPIAESLSGSSLESMAQHRETACPYYSPRLGLRKAAVRIFLHKLHIAMVAHHHIARLSNYPAPLHRSIVQQAVHPAVEFQ